MNKQITLLIALEMLRRPDIYPWWGEPGDSEAEQDQMFVERWHGCFLERDLVLTSGAGLLKACGCKVVTLFGEVFNSVLEDAYLGAFWSIEDAVRWPVMAGT